MATTGCHLTFGDMDGSSTSPSLVVPYEIFDHIIDFLRPDHQSLASCALVCRSWLPRSRHLRFSDTVVKAGQVDPFVELVASPVSTFPACIAALIIRYRISWHGRKRWSLSPSMWKAITRLRRLRSLEIHHADILHVSPEVITSLRRLAIYHSTFNTEYQLFEMLRGVPFIEDLSLSYLDAKEYGQELVGVSLPPTLRSMDISYSSEKFRLMDCLSMPESTPPLTSLSLATIDGTTTFHKLSQIFVRSLRHLSLGHSSVHRLYFPLTTILIG